MGIEARELARPDGVLSYVLAGPRDAPGIGFLHGAFLDHRVFLPQVEHLCSRYRLLVPDLRHHGRSQSFDEFSIDQAADDVLALLDEEGIETAVLVGHSMGGLIAQSLIRRAPQRATGLVAVASPRASAPRSKAEWVSLSLSRMVLPLIPATRFYSLVGKTCGPDPDVTAYACEAAGLIPKERCRLIWAGVIRALRPDLAERFPLPTLLVVGGNDRAGTISKDHQYWRQRDRHARAATIPEAGHIPTLDCPDRFNKLLTEFVESNAMGGHTRLQPRS